MPTFCRDREVQPLNWCEQGLQRQRIDSNVNVAGSKPLPREARPWQNSLAWHALARYWHF